MLKTKSGFGLIELIIAMAIFFILLSIAAPNFSGWILNAKIRTKAESVLSGLQLARAEAVRRNSVVRFQLTTTSDDSCALDTAGPNWIVSLDVATGKCGTVASETTDPRIIQLGSSAEGSGGSTVLSSGQSSFVFDGMGRLTSPPSAVNIQNSLGLCIDAGGAARCLRVDVTSGGQIRMCDPALPNTTTQGCS